MNRRSFLATSAAGVATYATSTPSFGSDKTELKKGSVILFQGDSITDAGREKKNPVANKGLGRGYPSFAAKELHTAYPDLELQIHNRGISGHKVPDLAKRWDRDCIELKPDILSILIGVNDIWHMLNGRYKGTAESYRDGYAELLQRTKEALPETKIVVCEPFVLMSGTVKENEEKWFPEFDTRRKYAKEVATNAKATWVPFQTMFDKAVADGIKPEELAGDGVHPTPKGHQMMASAWRQAVGV